MYIVDIIKSEQEKLNSWGEFHYSQLTAHFFARKLSPEGL